MTSRRECFDTRPQIHKQKQNILPQNPQEKDPTKAVGPGRFPSWLHRKLPKGNNLWATNHIVNKQRLHTVCEEAKCPNLLECWSKKTATFLAMGKECTRSCGFCDIQFSKTPAPLESDEPERIATSVAELGLNHVVITMVARDDLPDGGAQHLTNIVAAIRHLRPSTTVELLTSDFNGNKHAYDLIIKSQPEIFNHNIETVRSMTPRVRHTASYDRSLALLKYIKDHSENIRIKSGIMVGLGETDQEVIEALKDLYAHGCDIVTIGQYLQPNRRKLRVKNFIPPETFKNYETEGYRIGIKQMYCGPFVRSSYNAEALHVGG